MSQAPAPPAPHAAEVGAELAVRLRLVVGRLSRLLSHGAKGELTMSQSSALNSVGCVGPLRLGDLAAHEHVAAPTLSRVVAVLEEQGLVERRPDPGDARAGLLSLTETGERRLRRLREDSTSLLARAVDGLEWAARDRLAGALPGLEVLVERLARADPGMVSTEEAR